MEKNRGSQLTSRAASPAEWPQVSSRCQVQLPDHPHLGPTCPGAGMSSSYCALPDSQTHKIVSIIK